MRVLVKLTLSQRLRRRHDAADTIVDAEGTAHVQCLWCGSIGLTACGARLLILQPVWVGSCCVQLLGKFCRPHAVSLGAAPYLVCGWFVDAALHLSGCHVDTQHGRN